MAKKQKNAAAVALGKLGGKSKSPAKVAAARENGKKSIKVQVKHLPSDYPKK